MSTRNEYRFGQVVIRTVRDYTTEFAVVLGTERVVVAGLGPGSGKVMVRAHGCDAQFEVKMRDLQPDLGQAVGYRIEVSA